MQIPPGLSTLLFDLALDCIPASQVLEHVDQLDQDPQTHGQDFILQLFWSPSDPVHIPPGLSTLLFDLALDCIPASHVLEQVDQLDQDAHTHGQDFTLQLF